MCIYLIWSDFNTIKITPNMPLPTHDKTSNHYEFKKYIYIHFKCKK